VVIFVLSVDIVLIAKIPSAQHVTNVWIVWVLAFAIIATSVTYVRERIETIMWDGHVESVTLIESTHLLTK